MKKLLLTTLVALAGLSAVAPAKAFFGWYSYSPYYYSYSPYSYSYYSYSYAPYYYAYECCCC